MKTNNHLYFLQVVDGHGQDRGQRLRVDARIRTIGRARDADLVLSDLSVSRTHAQVLATDRGVQFAVCDGASSLLVNGRSVRAVDAVPGDRVALGGTTLRVEADTFDAPPSPRTGRTDVRTLLTGAAADVRGLASLHALVEALDACREREGLDAVLLTWGAEHASATRIEVQQQPESRGSGLEMTEGPNRSGTIFSVPAPCDDPMLLVVTSTIAPERVTDSFRRVLVMAGRLVASAVMRLRRIEAAATEVDALRVLSFGRARGFLGTSEAARELANLVPKLAARDVSVLIEGETGSGKSFVARLIHEASPRASEPLRVINCAAIPENLLESELFGYERGAFTGAVAARPGAFEAAGRGTVLLDEVGELTPANQAKLLRVLEDKRFERIGSNRSIELRARVLCATNRDLEAMVKAETFRSDLFFRISVVRVCVPPLRERGEDLLLLARHLLADTNQTGLRQVTGFTPDALEAIERYPWPGNVRELRNAIEHAVALGDGALVAKADLPASVIGRRPQPEDENLIRVPCDLASLEKRAIEAALREANGNKVKTAALLGIGRTTLYAKMQEYGLEKV